MAVPAIPAAGLYNKDCPPLILNLSQFASKNFESYTDQLGLLGRNGFFRSPFRNDYRFLETEISQNADGKLHTAELKWMQRFVDADLADCTTVDPCTGTDSPPFQSQNVTFNPICTAVQESMSRADWDKTCHDPEDQRLSNIMVKLQRGARAHEVKLMTQIIPLTGGWSSDTIAASKGGLLPANAPEIGTKYTFANDLINASGTVDANMIHELVELGLENELYDNVPVVLGGFVHPLMTKVDTLRQIGCCSDIGIDQRAAAESFGGLARYNSRYIHQAIAGAGGDPRKDFYMLHPGAVQYMEYFRYRNHSYNHALSFSRVFTNPVDGEQWDMKVHWDDCNERVTATFWKRGMPFVMPTTLYKTGDHMEGTNGFWELALP